MCVLCVRDEQSSGIRGRLSSGSDVSASKAKQLQPNASLRKT